MNTEIITASPAEMAFHTAKTWKAKLAQRLSAPLFFTAALLVAGCDEKAPVVAANTLEHIQIPAPKFAPQNGIWSSAYATKDGDRLINFMDGDVLWASLRFLDCNLPRVKEATKTMTKDKLGDYVFCSEPPNAKLKDYSMWVPNEDYRAVRVGHLVIMSGTGAQVTDKIDGKDIEGFLGTLDLAAYAKL